MNSAPAAVTLSGMLVQDAEATAPDPSTEPGVLERDQELRELDFAIAEAREGAGRHVVVLASAGLGKTTLLEHAARRAERAGLDVLRARGGEFEGDFSFGVARQLLEPRLAAAGDDERRRWLGGAAELAASVLDPGGPAVAGGDEGEEVSYPRLHGLYWLCANLAQERPLAIVIDDAHWADEPSLTFAAFLARRVADLPLLLVVGTRPADEAYANVLCELLADPAARVLRPGPLSLEAVADRVAARLDAPAEPAFCAACHAATGGNPLLLAELLHEVRAERIAPVAGQAHRVEALQPAGIRNLVLLRLARAGHGAGELARTAAVLGEGVGLEEAAAIAGLDDREAGEALAALVRADILADSSSLGFVHPIIRASIYEDIPLAERREHHGRAATVLRDRGASARAIAAQIIHARTSGDWAVGVLRDAAREALALGDAEAAQHYLRRALEERVDEGERFELELELGHAEARTGAASAAETLRGVAEGAPCPRVAARAAIELAGLMKFAGHSVSAVETLRGALSRLDDFDRELSERLRVELIGTTLISMAARPLLAGEIAALSDPGERSETPLERATLAALAFNGFAGAMPHDRVAELARRAIGDGRMPTDPLAGGHTFVSAVIALMFAERFDEADTLYTQALEDARRRGSAVAFATASSLRSVVAYRRGRIIDAEADARAALDLAGEVEGAQGFLAAALGTLIYGSLDRGTADDDLERLADRLIEEGAADSLPHSHAIHARACLRIHRGDLRGGYEELLRAGERELAWGARNPAITPWRSTAALVAIQLGEAEAGLRLAREEAELAREFGAPRCLGVALRALGLAGPEDERVAVLEQAVATLERSAAELELARALIDLGSAQRRAGHRIASRLPLARGRELAVNCGATALGEHAHHERFLASGARPRRTALTGYEALTPSERRVARMAATGLSNREIAQALFVTERTVETHLHNSYGKLEIGSRRELGSVLPETDD